MANLEKDLIDRLAPAFAAVAGEPADPVVHRSRRADFQADGAPALARTLGRPPADIARAVLEHADLANLADADVARPGFINLRLSRDALEQRLAAANADPRLGVPLAARPDIVVIDYSHPNVAKEMHVGHLRSTVIGDAAARLLTWLGHDVRRANHIGDWGTPFGMLIERLVDIGEAEAAQELSVGDLTAFYRAARAKFDADPTFADRSRRRVVMLQSGDAATVRLWRLLVEESETYFLSVYSRLGVTLTPGDFRGESFYNDRLAPLVAELDGLGLLRDSDGAACVFPADFAGRDGEALPIIVRKSDGGYGYGATDLAAIRYRTRELGADRLLYVVGTPQRQHLEMVFQTAREAGWLTVPAVHVSFGQVLGSDGRRLATRAGETVKLADLLDEAVDRAAAVVQAKNSALDADARSAVARAVGIGAVKYADLSTSRGKDYVFDWDRMLATNGDTGAYLQYAHARVRSIFRRGGAEPDPTDHIALGEPAERALGLELLAFPGVVEAVAASLEFHQLTGHLQAVANAFTTFFEHCPVLKADPAVRSSRLALCDLTGRTLSQGLDLLGIEAPTPM